MNRLPLAQIEQVYAVQFKDFLMIVAEGMTSGSESSLHIWKSHTKVYPPVFEIYETHGDPGSDSQAATKRPVAGASWSMPLLYRLQGFR